jgi:glucose uptake protein GlcU
MVDQVDVLGFSLLILSLACLGTWPALLRLCSMHDLRPYGRLPSYKTCCCSCIDDAERLRNICHVYLDYSTAYFFVSVAPLVFALFLSDESSASLSPLLVLVAMIGGSLLSIGNLSLQWATAVYGAPLTTVLAIQASLTVVLGTSLNYVLQPDKTSRPEFLLAGVGVFLLAITFATAAQMRYSPQQEDERPDSLVYTELEVAGVPSLPRALRSNDALNMHQFDDQEDGIIEGDLPDGQRNTEATISSALPIDDASKAFYGVAIAVFGGLCFGVFSPAFNIAVNDPLGWATAGSSDDNPDGAQIDSSTGSDLPNQLYVARANVWFSFAFWMASCIGNTVLMQQQESHLTWVHLWKQYLTQDSILDRHLAFTAGTICAVGNILQFQGGQLVGYAAADLVQAFPVVSTLWDVFLFHEFLHLEGDSYMICLLLSMYASYLSGIGLLAGSSFV